MDHHTEQDPLLPDRHVDTPSRTPIPWRPVLPLICTNFVIPLSFEIVFPFVSQMILDNGIAKSPATVGYFSGVVESVFSVMSLVAIFPCGILSQKIGRKPIIVAGNLGLAISVGCFGISRTFLQMIISRCIAGTLGGTISIAKTMQAEVSDKSNEGIIVSMAIIAYRTGQALSFPMGGLLTHPARHISHFDTEFWRTNPFLLPCIVASGIALISTFINAVLLPETLTAARKREAVASPAPTIPRNVLTPKIISLLFSTFVMCWMSEAILSVYPLFAFTPIELGGLGMDEGTIGMHLGLRAVLSVSALVLYPAWQRRLGTARLYKVVMSLLPLVMLALPLLNLLARRGMIGSWLFNVVLVAMFSLWSVAGMTYTANPMMINNYSPDAEALSFMNSAAQAATVLAQAVAPAGVTAFFAVSIKTGIADGNLIWIVLTSITCAAALHSYTLNDSKTDWRET